MKIICKTIIPLFLAIILSSCNGDVAAIPTMSQVNIMGTAISIAKTEVVMTMTAVPTAKLPPPTATFPPPTIVSPDAYAEKLDYAMTTARRIYTLYPYANDPIKVGMTGWYSGCTETNDFINSVFYTVDSPEIPFKTINTAFVKYFQIEGWEFTEATLSLVGDHQMQNIKYDAYRISSKDIPALERLEVDLTDNSNLAETNYAWVLVKLTHIESKGNFRYLSEGESRLRGCTNGWFWEGLYKQDLIEY